MVCDYVAASLKGTRVTSRLPTNKPAIEAVVSARVSELRAAMEPLVMNQREVSDLNIPLLLSTSTLLTLIIA